LAYEKGCKEMERGRMHAGKLTENSPLQILYEAFLKRKPGEIVTTLELAMETGIMSISTRISELRQNGISISKAQYMGLSKTGRKIYAYTLLKGR